MKKLITILLIVSLLFVPSFVYAEGGKEMATPNYQGIAKPGDDLDRYLKSRSQGIGGSQGLGDSAPNQPITLNPTLIQSTYTKGSDSMPDNTNYLEELYRAQLEARRRALMKQRDSMINSLDLEQGTIKEDMYGMRNKAAAQSDVGALNFAQFMASRGVQGNAGAMPEIYRNNALQGNIGAINRQEAAENARIASARTQVDSAYQNDLAAARNQNQSDYLSSTLNQINADRAAALEQQRYNTELSRLADTTSYNRLQDTKNEYVNTIGQFSKDYQAEIDKVSNDGDTSNDWQLQYLAAARAQKINDQEAQKTAEAKTLDAQQREQVNNAIQMFGQLGYLTPQMVQILADYGLTQDDITRMYAGQNTSGSSGGSSGGYGLSW